MAREHANIRLDMWGDSHWRSLSRDAQWLYELLLTHPETNRAGVCDWRPARLSRMAAGTSADDVRAAAAELEREFFVVVDEGTEEILVRSFVKYDGVLKQPNMAVTMAQDWAGVASSRLRSVVAFEVQRLREMRPEWSGWRAEEKLSTLLASPGIDVRYPSLDPKSDPSGDPSVEGQPYPSVRGHSTTTATSTTTNASHSRAREAKKPELPLPVSWSPSVEHIARAKAMGVDVLDEAENFRLHAVTHDRRAANWNGAFTTWLKKSKPVGATAEIPDFGVEEWMYRA